MKRWTAGLTAALLAAALLLGGCTEAPAGSSRVESKKTESTSSAGTETSESAIGVYKGKTVTMKYRLKTNIDIDNTVTSLFHKGYITACEKDFFFIDEDGKILGDAYYKFAYPFENDGRALVEKTDGIWVYIDTAGQEGAEGKMPGTNSNTVIYESDGLFGLQDKDGDSLTEAIFSFISSVQGTANYAVLLNAEHKNVLINQQGEIQATLPDDCVDARMTDKWIVCAYEIEGERKYRLFNDSGHLLNEQYFSAIGSFEEELAPVTQDGKVGLVDGDGNIVIEPTLPLDDKGKINLGLSENKIVGSVDGKLAILEVTLL